MSLPAITTSVSTCMDERAALTSAIVRTCRKRFPVAQKGFAGEYSQTLRGAVVAAASSRDAGAGKYERCSEARRRPGGGCAPCAATLLSSVSLQLGPRRPHWRSWRTTETLGRWWACRVHLAVVADLPQVLAVLPRQAGQSTVLHRDLGLGLCHLAVSLCAGKRQTGAANVDLCLKVGTHALQMVRLSL